MDGGFIFGPNMDYYIPLERSRREDFISEVNFSVALTGFEIFAV